MPSAYCVAPVVIFDGRDPCRVTLRSDNIRHRRAICQRGLPATRNMTGILNVCKPTGITSHAVVSRVRKFIGQKRVGHAGTLDPMASGVLPILIGNAAGITELVMEHDKTYRAGVLLGKVTETGDITGTVLSETTPRVSEEMLEEAITRFIGEIEQVPPMYSALKVNGVTLYKLARQGIEVERQARKVTIYDIKRLSALANDRFDIEVSCSKGTYIRTLAEDIGQALGCGATLDALERTRCGMYDLSDAVSLETLEEYYHENAPEKIEALLRSPEEYFTSLPVVRLPAFYERLALSGCEIYLKKARVSRDALSEDGRCRLYDENDRFYAVAALGNYEAGEAVKIQYRFI